jgi:hypothetical protein
MSEVSVRPRLWDALVLLVLAVVIVGGLVHYGRPEGDGRGTTASAQATASVSPPVATSPTAEATAPPDSPSPSSPATPPAQSRTCWDGRDTTSLRVCGLPEGARGLAWVFPSFARDRPWCHEATPNDDSYPVLTSYACFQRALGQPVTVTYDQVKDPAQVRRWLLARVGPAHMRTVPGPNGGRRMFLDGVSRPARITGTYNRFPYVVSVYAASPQAAVRAWRLLVRQRPEDQIRGVVG